jgi:hypothetical protein
MVTDFIFEESKDKCNTIYEDFEDALYASPELFILGTFDPCTIVLILIHELKDQILQG